METRRRGWLVEGAGVGLVVALAGALLGAVVIPRVDVAVERVEVHPAEARPGDPVRVAGLLRRHEPGQGAFPDPVEVEVEFRVSQDEPRNPRRPIAWTVPADDGPPKLPRPGQAQPTRTGSSRSYTVPSSHTHDRRAGNGTAVPDHARPAPGRNPCRDSGPPSCS